MNIKGLRQTYAEINLDNLAHNIKAVKNHLKEGTIISAVVKANAYGHGAIEVAKICLENGIDRFAVATLSEAIELRKAGIDSAILILSYTAQKDFEDVIKYDIIQNIDNYDAAVSLSNIALSKGKKAKVHIDIDTGMSRIGYQAIKGSIDEIIAVSKLPNLEIEGIFSHFARADERDKTFTRTQYDLFISIVKMLEDRGLEIPIKHISNSAAIIDMPEYNLDMVRPGIVLYGLYPSKEVDSSIINLKPVMTLKSEIAMLKDIEANVGVSYGHSFVTEAQTKVGVIPIGYADGLFRNLSNKMYCSINNQRVKMIGTICMDQSMLDLTGVECSVGDEVILFGEGNKSVSCASDVAVLNGTINYEIVSAISRRVPRVYIKDGRVLKYEEYLSF